MMLRMFLPVVTGPQGDVGFEYLRLMEATGILVRALPIGPATAIGGGERRWYEIGHLFTTPITNPFVNVVCAPAGFMLGTRTPMSALGGTSDLASRDGGTTDVMVFPPELRAVLGELGATKRSANPEIVYEPQTAFGGLWTKGIKNVAIVTDAAHIDDREREQLARYDLVMFSSFEVAKAAVPMRDDNWAVLESGSQASRVIDLISLLENTCSEPGTTAPMPTCPDTDARRAITWRLSTPLTASSSRSPSSATTGVNPPSPGTAISTISPSRSSRSWVIRTWRSFTRRLAFWKRSTSGAPSNTGTPTTSSPGPGASR